MAISKNRLLWMYERMRLIRDFEEFLHTDFAAGNIPGSSTCTLAKKPSPWGYALISPMMTSSPAPTGATAIALPKAYRSS